MTRSAAPRLSRPKYSSHLLTRRHVRGLIVTTILERIVDGIVQLAG
jgi:hypothetical protein